MWSVKISRVASDTALTLLRRQLNEHHTTRSKLGERLKIATCCVANPTYRCEEGDGAAACDVSTTRGYFTESFVEAVLIVSVVRGAHVGQVEGVCAQKRD